VVAIGAGRRDGHADSLSAALVVLGGGPSQRHAIDAAHALGVRTVVCDIDPDRGDVPVSSEDLAGVIRVAREVGAGGLIAPGTDWPVRIAAAAATELGLDHPLSPIIAERVTDKLEQRRFLDEAGVPQAAWSLTGPPSYPAVVKPADRQGQRGLSVVRTADGLAAAERRARQASRTGTILYEAFVPGPEVTVNGFVLPEARHHTVMVTDREHFEDAPGVCEMHVFPSRNDDGDAASVAERAVSMLGMASGPTYVQLVIGPEGPVVMEVAARLGGGHDSELARRVVGVDLADAAVRAALGMPVDEAMLDPRPNGAGVIRFLRAPEGTLVAADGPAEATFYHSPGHVYGPLRMATDRAGYVLCQASERQEALERARTASEAVRFEVR
jgi:biotin carboxylase